MWLANLSCPACGCASMPAASSGFTQCYSCGYVVDLGGNSQAGDLRRIAATPGRAPWEQNKNLYETIPRVQVPQAVSQQGDAEIILTFANPFTAGGDYALDAFGEIGSNNPVNTAYSRRVEYRALWSSPIFDLRTELGASQGTASQAMPINRGAAFGQGTRLIVQLRRGQAGAGDERRYNYQFVDQTALFDTSRLAQTSSPQSISAAVRNAPITTDSTGTATTLLSFSAPANPVRYWRVTLVVDVIANDLVPNAAPALHGVTWWTG